MDTYYSIQPDQLRLKNLVLTQPEMCWQYARRVMEIMTAEVYQHLPPCEAGWPGACYRLSRHHGTLPDMAMILECDVNQIRQITDIITDKHFEITPDNYHWFVANITDRHGWGISKTQSLPDTIKYISNGRDPERFKYNCPVSILNEWQTPTWQTTLMVLPEDHRYEP